MALLILRPGFLLGAGCCVKGVETVKHQAQSCLHEEARSLNRCLQHISNTKHRFTIRAHGDKQNTDTGPQVFKRNLITLYFVSVVLPIYNPKMEYSFIISLSGHKTGPYMCSVPSFYILLSSSFPPFPSLSPSLSFFFLNPPPPPDLSSLYHLHPYILCRKVELKDESV